MSTSKHQVGDPVWIYDRKDLREAVISEQISYLDDTYKVKLIKPDKIIGEYLEKQLWCYFQVFARPTEWLKLVDQLREDADLLNRWADTLEMDNWED